MLSSRKVMSSRILEDQFRSPCSCPLSLSCPSPSHHHWFQRPLCSIVFNRFVLATLSSRYLQNRKPEVKWYFDSIDEIVTVIVYVRNRFRGTFVCAYYTQRLRLQTFCPSIVGERISLSYNRENDVLMTVSFFVKRNLDDLDGLSLMNSGCLGEADTYDGILLIAPWICQLEFFFAFMLTGT